MSYHFQNRKEPSISNAFLYKKLYPQTKTTLSRIPSRRRSIAADAPFRPPLPEDCRSATHSPGAISKDTNPLNTQGQSALGQGPQQLEHIYDTDFPQLQSKVGQLSRCSLPRFSTQSRKCPQKWRVRNDLSPLLFSFDMPKPTKLHNTYRPGRGNFSSRAIVPNFVNLHRTRHAHMKKKARTNHKYYG